MLRFVLACGVVLALLALRAAVAQDNSSPAVTPIQPASAKHKVAAATASLELEFRLSASAGAKLKEWRAIKGEAVLASEQVAGQPESVSRKLVVELAPGENTIVVSVTDTAGKEKRFAWTLTRDILRAVPRDGVSLAIRTNAASVEAGKPVEVSVLVVTGTAQEFVWHFGDGQTASGNSVWVAYAKAGNYTITVLDVATGAKAMVGMAVTAAKWPEVPGFKWLREEKFQGGSQVHAVQIYRCEAFAKALGIDRSKSDVACEFVLIPAGRFMMGNLEGESSPPKEESPMHPVTLKAFLLARTEVCQMVWRGLIGSTRLTAEPSFFKGDGLPVERVSWEECAKWCRANDLRLPTEAEWECACRAGGSTTFATGNALESATANYDGRYPFKSSAKGEYRAKTVAVGSLPCNAFGLFEMHGNVWEWCADSFLNNYYGSPADGSAWESPNALCRVQRGGGWRSEAANCRCAERGRDEPGDHYNDLGFRPAKSIP